MFTPAVLSALGSRGCCLDVLGLACGRAVCCASVSIALGCCGVTMDCLGTGSRLTGKTVRACGGTGGDGTGGGDTGTLLTLIAPDVAG